MKILYFASIRQTVGFAEESLDQPADVNTIEQLVAYLTKQGANYQSAFADRDRLRYAVNQEFADAQTPVSDKDEIAFFPPVTGG